MTSPFLRSLVSGATNPKGNLGDWQHASRLFVDDSFRLAPKFKFGFHVSFKINQDALKNLNLKFRHGTEINMMVKSIDLPKFNIATETINQYNRKKVIQHKIEYSPVNMRMHDDNQGITRQLWENYYAYYYADSTAAKKAINYYRNATASSSYIRTPYGLDNNSTIPFFDSIVIYQFARKEWTSYTLVNPMIKSWNHDTMDYSQNAPVEHQITIDYESVAYDTGSVAGNPIPGFGEEHYDRTPSPITVAGGGSATVTGPGGVLSGISQVADAITSGTAFEGPIGAIGTAIQAVNTYNNLRALTIPGLREEGTNIIRATAAAVTSLGISGIRNIAFPINDTANNNTTVASLRNQ